LQLVKVYTVLEFSARGFCTNFFAQKWGTGGDFSEENESFFFVKVKNGNAEFSFENVVKQLFSAHSPYQVNIHLTNCNIMYEKHYRNGIIYEY